MNNIHDMMKKVKQEMILIRIPEGIEIEYDEYDMSIRFKDTRYKKHYKEITKIVIDKVQEINELINENFGGYMIGESNVSNLEIKYLYNGVLTKDSNYYNNMRAMFIKQIPSITKSIIMITEIKV